MLSKNFYGPAHCTDCGSYFLENVVEWMEDCASSVEGKLSCPGCRYVSLKSVGLKACKRPAEWVNDAPSAYVAKHDLSYPSVKSNVQRTGGPNQLGWF